MWIIDFGITSHSYYLLFLPVESFWTLYISAQLSALAAGFQDGMNEMILTISLSFLMFFETHYKAVNDNYTLMYHWHVFLLVTEHHDYSFGFKLNIPLDFMMHERSAISKDAVITDIVFTFLSSYQGRSLMSSLPSLLFYMLIILSLPVCYYWSFLGIITSYHLFSSLSHQCQLLVSIENILCFFLSWSVVIQVAWGLEFGLRVLL